MPFSQKSLLYGLLLGGALSLFSFTTSYDLNTNTDPLETSSKPNRPTEQETTTHKIVFHLMTGSEQDRAGLLRNIRNVLVEWPEARITVVSHSGGMALLTKANNHLTAEIDALRQKGVTFNACENTMASKSIAPEDLISAAEPVPSGIVEVVKLQEQGYAYIRAGY